MRSLSVLVEISFCWLSAYFHNFCRR